MPNDAKFVPSVLHPVKHILTKDLRIVNDSSKFTFLEKNPIFEILSQALFFGS